MTYPTYNPTDRRYVHGDWPTKRHKFMANTEQRMLYATAKVDQEMRLTYANQPSQVIHEFLCHYDSVYGQTVGFKLPTEVGAGWKGGKQLIGLNQVWRYKEQPRVTSNRGLISTLEVTLTAATDQIQPLSCSTNNKQRRTAYCPQIFPSYSYPPDPSNPTQLHDWIVTFRTQQIQYAATSCADGATRERVEITTDPKTWSSTATGIRWEINNEKITSAGCSGSGFDVIEPKPQMLQFWYTYNNGTEYISTAPLRDASIGTLSGVWEGSGTLVDTWVEILSVTKDGEPVDLPPTTPLNPDDPNCGGEEGDGGGLGRCDVPTPDPKGAPSPSSGDPGIGDGNYPEPPDNGYPGDGDGSGDGSGDGPSGPTPEPSPGPGQPLPPPQRPVPDGWPAEPDPDGLVDWPPGVPDDAPWNPEVGLPDIPDLPGYADVAPYLPARWGLRFWFDTNYFYCKHGTSVLKDPEPNPYPYTYSRQKREGITDEVVYSSSSAEQFGGLHRAFANIYNYKDNFSSHKLTLQKDCSESNYVYCPGYTDVPGLRPPYSWEGSDSPCLEPDNRVEENNYWCSRLVAIQNWTSKPEYEGYANCNGITPLGNAADTELGGGNSGSMCGQSSSYIGYEKSFRIFTYVEIEYIGEGGGILDPWPDNLPRRYPLIDGRDAWSGNSTRQLRQETRSSTKTSTKFPAFRPSSRNYSFGDWNVKEAALGLSSQLRTMTLPSTATKSDTEIQLSFANRGDSVARAILQHFHAYLGSYKSFKLPREIFKDWNGKLDNGDWIYASSPQVVTTHPGTSTTSVRLINVNPTESCEIGGGSGGSSGGGSGGGDGGGADGPGGGKPTPSPGPGKPLPAPEPTVPVGWPPDFPSDAWPDGIPRDAPDIPSFSPPLDMDDWPGFSDFKDNLPPNRNWSIYFIVTIFDSYSAKGTVRKDNDPDERVEWIRTGKSSRIREPYVLSPTLWASWDFANVKIDLYPDRCVASNYMSQVDGSLPTPAGEIPAVSGKTACDPGWTDSARYFCNRLVTRVKWDCVDPNSFNYDQCTTTPDANGRTPWAYENSEYGANWNFATDVTGFASHWSTIVKVEVVYRDFTTEVGRGTFFDNTSKFQ